MATNLFVTAALPYANGPLHLGHMLEYIQADIWCRYQTSLMNRSCWFVCADDTHGTPIMLRAAAEGISPEQLIAKVSEEHQKDFRDFSIAVDYYGSTHDQFTYQQVQSIYFLLKEQGFLYEKVIQQLYDPVEQMFLPDRYVTGECPRCQATDQYGDCCEKCGSSHATTDLKNPISVISGASVILRDTTHIFFRLSDPLCVDTLREWVRAGLSIETANKIAEWLGRDGEEHFLTDWDISRDAPYFGIPVPGYPDKYFYVWLDAPMGYMSAIHHLCQLKKLCYTDVWNEDSSCHLYHFIGKDILYFHALFWPAILKASGHRLPTELYVHGFLTINGEKMSKSRGTFITARHYLDSGLNPEWLRYYLAYKSSASIQDIDLDKTDFMNRVNSDLIGKYINIASRSSKILATHFSSQVLSKSDILLEAALELEQQCQDAGAVILEFYNQRELSQALRYIMKLADSINSFIDQYKPWGMSDSKISHDVCSTSIRLFILLTWYLSPVLPVTYHKVIVDWLHLNPDQCHEHILIDLSSFIISPYQPLMGRIAVDLVDKL